MRISKAIVKDGIMKQPVTIELDAAVERMKSKTLLEVKETPQLLVSATFGRGGLDDVRTMTGLLVLHAESTRRQLVRQWQQAVYAAGVEDDRPSRTVYSGSRSGCRRSGAEGHGGVSATVA